MTLHIYGIIGSSWDELDVSSVQRRASEHDEDEPMDVYLNSPGGDPFAGSAIASILQRHKGKTTVHIDGLAASAATLAMLGGDEIVMPDNAMLMVHNPWMFAGGDYRDMQKASEDLEKIRDSMIAAYKAKTGKDEEELKNLLDDETWMTAEEAVDHGFADKITDSVVEATLAHRLGSIDVSEFNEMPEDFAMVARSGRQRIAAMAAQRGAGMTQQKKKKQGPQSAPSTKVSDVAETSSPETPAVVPVDFKSLTRDVKTLCDRVGLSADDAMAIVTADDVTTIDDARAKALDLVAESTTTPNFTGVNGSITMGVDERDKFKAAAVDAIQMRGGKKPHDGQNQLRSMRLSRLAEECLVNAGGTRGVTQEDTIDRAMNIKAFGGHSTSDFPEILQDSVSISVLRGYDQAAMTWDQWCVLGSLSDFKSAPLVGLNAFDGLRQVNELGEYEMGSINERGEEIKLKKYGRRHRISMEAIIDDRMGVLTQLPERMGRAAARVANELAYGVLSENATLKSGTALFHADHGNTHADALGYSSLDALVVAMTTQTFKTPDGDDEKLRIAPKKLVVPPQLHTDALQLMASEVIGENNQTNIFRGRFDVIMDQELQDNATRYYLIADPLVSDTVMVAFRDGNPQPFVDQKDGWKGDWIEYKIRQEAAAAPMGYRALQRGGTGG